MSQDKQIEVKKTWTSGKDSITFVIPRSIARKYNIVSGNHLLIETTENGILIKKLEVYK